MKGPCDKGTIFTASLSAGLEVDMDTDFARNWHKEVVEDRDIAHSRHGYIMQSPKLPHCLDITIADRKCSEFYRQ